MCISFLLVLQRTLSPSVKASTINRKQFQISNIEAMQHYHIHLSPFRTYAPGVELSGSSIPYEGVTHDQYVGKHHLTLSTRVSLVLGVVPTNKITFSNESISTHGCATVSNA